MSQLFSWILELIFHPFQDLLNGFVHFTSAMGVEEHANIN